MAATSEGLTIGVLCLITDSIQNDVISKLKPKNIKLVFHQLTPDELICFNPPNEWHAVILMHPATEGRLSITDVADARYTKLLPNLNHKYSGSICVIAFLVRNLEINPPDLQIQALEFLQPTLFEMTRSVIICGKLIDMTEKDFKKLDEFVKYCWNNKSQHTEWPYDSPIFERKSKVAPDASSDTSSRQMSSTEKEGSIDEPMTASRSDVRGDGQRSGRRYGVVIFLNPTEGDIQMVNEQVKFDTCVALVNKGNTYIGQMKAFTCITPGPSDEKIQLTGREVIKVLEFAGVHLSKPLLSRIPSDEVIAEISTVPNKSAETSSQQSAQHKGLHHIIQVHRIGENQRIVGITTEELLNLKHEIEEVVNKFTRRISFLDRVKPPDYFMASISLNYFS